MTKKEQLLNALEKHSKKLKDINREMDVLEVQKQELTTKIDKIMTILKIEETDHVKYATRTVVNKKYVVDNFKDKDFVKIEKVETVKETINRKELEKYVIQNNIDSSEIFKTTKTIKVKD